LQPIPVPLRHGIVLATRVRYSILNPTRHHRVTRYLTSATDASVIVVNDTTTYRAEVMLRKDQSYRIVVDVKNAAGYNNALSLQPVIIEKESASE